MDIKSIEAPSLILIIVVALLIFGPEKLPKIGSVLGQMLRKIKVNK